MKKKVLVILSVILCVIVYFNVIAPMTRSYEYKEQTFTTNEDISSLQIDELDTRIMIEFTNKVEPLHVSYCESKDVRNITYDISIKDGLLQIKKKDITNGMAIHLFASDEVEEIPELRIKIPGSYMDNINIKATDSSVKIIGGEINTLNVATTYDPIIINHTAINNFTGVTKYDSIVGTIVGDEADFTVDYTIKEGNNNLSDHDYNGQKKMNLKTEYGDIDIKFVNE